MTDPELINRGKDLLASITSQSTSTLKFRQQLEDYVFKEEFKDDVPAWLTCVSALKGADCGNFGVGSIIMDDHGNLAAMGYNQIFYPYFRQPCNLGPDIQMSPKMTTAEWFIWLKNCRRYGLNLSCPKNSSRQYAPRS